MTIYEKVISRKVIIGADKPKPVATVEGGSSNGSTGVNGNAPAHGEANGSNGRANGSTPKTDIKPQGKSTISQLLKELFWPTKQTKVEPGGRASTGQILNLIRTDAEQVAKRFVDIDRIITTPIGAAISIWLLWRLLGWSSFLAIALIFVMQALNAIVARLQVHWQRLRKKSTDDRVQMNSQFIEVIRHLRWYGWEEVWLAKVMATRRYELNLRILNIILSLCSYGLTVCSSSFLPVVAFFSYTAFAGHKLRIDIIFPTLQLIRFLQSWLRDIPSLITTLLEAYVAMDRIKNFLIEPDKEETNSPVENDVSDEESSPLRLEDCSFAWPGTSEPILSDVNLTVGPGLTMVYGSIGTGKTALLQALLGEMERLTGQVDIPNETIAYCSQTPWLQSISIRDNILFFAPYDEARYQKVLDCCALLPDLATFKDGDMSHIGEK
jgi:ABC-type multidrug transport system fused ATPase/permease subunit